MPTDYELRAEPEAGEEGIALGEFTLADETVSLILPKDWRLLRETFRTAQLGVSQLAGAKLSVTVEPYEDPAAIDAGDLERYLNPPELPPLDPVKVDSVRDENGVADFEQLTLRMGGTTFHPDRPDLPEGLRIWRKLGLLRPRHIRVLQVQLQIPAAENGSAAAQELEDMIDHLLKFVRFADRETAADRIGPSEGLKLVELRDTIYLRLPEDARRKRKNADGPGMWVYDHAEDDRWTLYIDFEVFRAPKPEDAREIVSKMVTQMEGEGLDGNRLDLSFDPMPDRSGEAMATTIYHSIEDGEILRHAAWHRVLCQGDKIVFGNFVWVVVEARREEPDPLALTELIAREVRNAVLFDAEGSNDEQEAVAP